jgi:hypothetical protein
MWRMWRAVPETSVECVDPKAPIINGPMKGYYMRHVKSLRFVIMIKLALILVLCTVRADGPENTLIEVKRVLDAPHGINWISGNEIMQLADKMKNDPDKHLASIHEIIRGNPDLEVVMLRYIGRVARGRKDLISKIEERQANVQKGSSEEIALRKVLRILSGPSVVGQQTEKILL